MDDSIELADGQIRALNERVQEYYEGITERMAEQEAPFARFDTPDDRMYM
jgi:hypothetical protein